MLKKVALFAVLILGLSACNDKVVYSKFQSTDNGTWSKDKPVIFEFSMQDSLRRHDVFITLRNDNDYPYSNLFLIAGISFPDGRQITDTLEYEMARPDGSWLGSGSGSVKENKLWYKENIVFPESGVYKVSISHAMRNNGSVQGIIELPGITDIGLQIEKRE